MNDTRARWPELDSVFLCCRLQKVKNLFIALDRLGQIRVCAFLALLSTDISIRFDGILLPIQVPGAIRSTNHSYKSLNTTSLWKGLQTTIM
jgi:hypothetical protein